MPISYLQSFGKYSNTITHRCMLNKQTQFDNSIYALLDNMCHVYDRYDK